MRKYFFLLLSFFTTFSAVTQPTLAILGGAADKDDSKVATVVIDTISEELLRSGVYTIVERRELDAAALEQEFQLSGGVGESFEGADSVAFIQVISLDSGYFITARVINVETGEIEKQVSEGNIEEYNLISASKVLAANLVGVGAQISEANLMPKEEKKRQKRGGLLDTFSTITFNYQGGSIYNLWHPDIDDWDPSDWDDTYDKRYYTHAVTAKLMVPMVGILYLGTEVDIQFIGVSDATLFFTSPSTSIVASGGFNLNFLDFIQPYWGIGLGFGFHPILHSKGKSFFQLYGVAELGVNVLFKEKFIFHLGGIYREGVEFSSTYHDWAWKIGLGYSPDL